MLFFLEPKQIFYIHIVLFMQTHTMHKCSTFLKLKTSFHKNSTLYFWLIWGDRYMLCRTGREWVCSSLCKYSCPSCFYDGCIAAVSHIYCIYQKIIINHLPSVADDLDTAHTQWWHRYKVSDWTEDWRICKASCELERERERVSERQREKVRRKKIRIITETHKEHTRKIKGKKILENDKERKEKKEKGN